MVLRFQDMRCIKVGYNGNIILRKQLTIKERANRNASISVLLIINPR